LASGKPPKVHLTVRPREWWEAKFTNAGCVKDENAFRVFQQYGPDRKEISPHFFPFTCHSKLSQRTMISPLDKPR
jgi:hypothetical protein